MKKTIVILLTLIIVMSTACMLVACRDKKDPVIESYTISVSNYAVGDKYDKTDAKVIAVLSDGSQKTVTKNLVYVGDGEDILKLKDGCFTEKGEYTVKVYTLEEREDLFIGNWTIKVA